MSAHTPGPWWTDGTQQGIHGPIHNIWAHFEGQRTAVAVEHIGNPANARLIAAAPEMLAFIQNVALSEHRGDHSVLFESCNHCKARALLARLEG